MEKEEDSWTQKVKDTLKKEKIKSREGYSLPEPRRDGVTISLDFDMNKFKKLMKDDSNNQSDKKENIHNQEKRFVN